ncbi:MAG TPA: nicotinamide mononucleotide transporter family protein, partial [Gammaproteobacteria bacterium]|nr:nicotinamide mononucleotide transporter family protein [Gammaproteobacteria bacterium]
MTPAEILAAVHRWDVIEGTAVLLAIAYLVLAIRQSILCWLAAFLSSAIYLVVFFAARLYMESALQIFYAAMAVYGYRQWRYGGADHRGVAISTWPLRWHVVALGVIAATSIGLGSLMSRTDAVFPYLDAFTTSAAIVTTY